MRTIERPWENAYVVPGTTLVAGEYPGTYPGRAGPSQEEKLGRLLDAGITTVIDLTRPEDRMVPYETALRQIADERGVALTIHRRPIRDMGICEPDYMREVLDTIDTALAAGEGVYLHCWGGVGRTGTVVGCHLVRHGASGEEALTAVQRLFGTMSTTKVQRHPEGSPQTSAQRNVVRTWAANDRAATASPSVAGTVAETAARATTGRSTQSLSRGERIRGCLLGGAVGDALGWPVEFLSLGEIRRRFGPAGIRDFAPAPGGIGAITDDTQMTLFSAEGLLRARARAEDRGVCSPAMVVWYSYLRWYVTQGGVVPAERTAAVHEAGSWLLADERLHTRRAPGNTCLGGLATGRMGTLEEPLNDSKGCGGVMRAAPAGMVPGDPFQLGMELAVVTHGHPSGYLPAGALALMVALLLEGATLETAAEQAIIRVGEMLGHEETVAALEGALEAWRSARPVAAETVQSLGAGWTGEEALGIALYCALAADGDFAAGVRLAVNHGGDSDSTGSIAGQLLGLTLGEGAIPAAWLDQLELRREIGAIADDLAVGWRDDDEWSARYPGD